MTSLVYQLPTVLGTLAGMLVTLVSIVNETSPTTCLVKAVAAFAVFAGFGMILRYALTNIEEQEGSRRETGQGDHSSNTPELTLESVRPGASVAELLGEAPSNSLSQEETTAA